MTGPDTQLTDHADEAAAPVPSRGAAVVGAPPRYTHPALADVLNNRRWVKRFEPFPYIVAENVFTADFFAQMEAEFRRIEQEHPETFRRDMPGYDASGAQLDNFRDGPLGIFYTREWHDLTAAAFDVPATGDVTATLHHHEPGGEAGWPHQDLNPAWFPDPPAGPGEIRVPADGQVGYHKGNRPAGVTARETVRAVSMLFYLANPPWEPGDGGETGLYPGSWTRQPSVAVPPVNNSIVLFECTPFSWHGFISNRTKPRNSIVLWVHREKSEAVRRWGESSLAYW